MGGTHLIALERLRAAMRLVVSGFGSSESEIEAVAGNLIDANLTGHDAAFAVGLGVARQHADAVRVVAAQVGLDQVGGHRLGLGRPAAEAAHHVAHGGVQALQRDDVHGRHQRPFSRATSARSSSFRRA